MLKTIKMDERESTQKIATPPSSGDEEGKEASVDVEESSRSKDRAPQDEVVESVDSTKKLDKLVENWERGAQPEDLFSAQKLLSGRSRSPKLARQQAAKLRRYISNYGFKGEDEKLYLKVDAKRVPVAKALLNDDKERSFSIASHAINVDLLRSFYPADASQRSAT